MDLYIRFFMMTMVGLVGLSQVLTILIDGLFSEWDAFADIVAVARDLYAGEKRTSSFDRAEDVMLQSDQSRSLGTSTRLIQQRREELRRIDEVENQLNLPGRAPVTLEPIVSAAVAVKPL